MSSNDKGMGEVRYFLRSPTSLACDMCLLFQRSKRPNNCLRILFCKVFMHIIGINGHHLKSICQIFDALAFNLVQIKN